MGEAYLELKKYKEARHAYELASHDLNYTIPYAEKLKALINEGKKLLELKCYNEALEVFKGSLLFGPSQDIISFLTSYSTQEEFYFSQGMELFTQGRAIHDSSNYNDALFLYEAAILFMDKSLACKPTFGTYITKGKILFTKGEALLALKKYDETREAYQQAIKLKYFDERIYNRKIQGIFVEAEALYNSELYAESGALYRLLTLFNLEHNYEDIYKDKGRDLLSKAIRLSYKDACILYEQAIKFDPSNINVSVVRGGIA